MLTGSTSIKNNVGMRRRIRLESLRRGLITTTNLSLVVVVTFCATLLLIGRCDGIDEAVDFYDVLGIPRDAPQDEVKRSYRKMSLQYHPDKVAQTDEMTAEEAAEKFRLIAAAYAALNDSKTREYYDNYGHDYDDVKEYFDTIVKRTGTDELFKKSKGITLLFAANVKKFLANSNFTWVVLFYHPGCGSCRTSAPMFKHFAAQAAKQQPFKLRVGTVNCEVMMGVCHSLQSEYMGQTRIFPPGQEADSWYSVPFRGPLIADKLIATALSVKPMPKLRQLESDEQMEMLLKKVSSSSSSSASKKKPLHSVGVVFYQTPTCPPCRALKQQMPALLSEIGDVIEVATIDCTVRNCKVPHFPYLKMFYKRVDSSQVRSFPLKYDGQLHPGASALTVAAQILREISGFTWSAQDKAAINLAVEEL